MAATTTAKRPKADAPAQPATFDEIARKKMADTISEYRGLVGRAARDEELSGDDLARVLELLAYLALPDFAWERDVKAQREHTETLAREAAAKAELPEAESRAAKATARIAALEAELKSLREAQYRDTQVLPRKAVGYGQRRNELAVLHPHLFASVDDAARLRAGEKNKARSVSPAADQLGWSTS